MCPERFPKGLQQRQYLAWAGCSGLQLIEETAQVTMLMQQLGSTLIAGRFGHGLPRANAQIMRCPAVRIQ